MKLIIDIDEKDYANIKDCPTDYEYSVALMTIANGTPVSNEGDLISRSSLKEDLKRYFTNGEALYQILTIIDNAPTVEPEELKRVRNICEHWNDKSSSFVSACNAFEDILHIFKMGVGDMGGGAE